MSIITEAEKAMNALGDNADAEISKVLNNQALSSDSPLQAVCSLDQDWDNETTYLVFDDNSRIVVCNDDISTDSGAE